MNPPTPAREIDVLFNQLAEVLNACQVLDDATWQRYEWQAKKLLRTDPLKAHIVLGLLAVVRLDEKAAEHAFQKAARTSGWSPFLRMNYAVMLNHFHRPQDALNQLLAVAEQAPASFVLDESARCAYATGRLHLAASLLEKLSTRGPLPSLLQKHTDDLHVALKTVDALGLSDDTMAAIQAPAWQAIREQESAQGKVVTINDVVIPDDRPSILRTYWVPVSEEEGWAMNDRMNEIWAQSDDASPVEDFCPMIVGRGAA